MKHSNFNTIKFIKSSTYILKYIYMINLYVYIIMVKTMVTITIIRLNNYTAP